MATAEPDVERQVPNTDALIGTLVGGRFQITGRIAQGGMGCVYSATQQPLNRPVAIKVLRADGGPEDQESFRRRFLREANILSQLQHPNIVTLLDYGQISDLPGDHYFMAMEYLRGETLGRRLRSRGALSIRETLHLARQIGRGLREAHRRGFVHRDLKPSNIMLVPEDQQSDIVKLVDFGIGKVLTEAGLDLGTDDDDTRVGLLLGSPRHMAPEQIRGELIEPRTDLYGLGVVLFQALSGQLPFDGRTEVEILTAHCTLPAPKLSEYCPELAVPQSLSDLVDSLLRKQASTRPTIYEFLLKLADVEDELLGAPFSGASPSIPPPSSRATRIKSAETRTGRTISYQRPAADLERSRRELDLTQDSETFVTPLAVTPLRKKPLSVAVALLVPICAAALLIWQESLRPAKPSSAPAHASANAVVPPPKAERSNFVLTLDSLPSKATVSEQGMVLGTTPLTVLIERDATSTAPRHFSIEHDGYLPYEIEQGDSATDRSLRVTLKARPTLKGAVPLLHSAASRSDGPSALVPSAAYVSGALLEIRTRR